MRLQYVIMDTTHNHNALIEANTISEIANVVEGYYNNAIKINREQSHIVYDSILEQDTAILFLEDNGIIHYYYNIHPVLELENRYFTLREIHINFNSEVR